MNKIIIILFFMEIMNLLLNICKTDIFILITCAVLAVILVTILFYKMSKDIDCRDNVPGNSNNIIEKANGSR